jgi:phosphoglycolate phosphatase
MKILVLFDIDGTILTFNNKLGKKVFIDFLEEYLSMEVPDTSIPDFSGMTDLNILQLISENLNIPFGIIEKNIEKFWMNLNIHFSKFCIEENFEVLPGIRELIIELHNNESVIIGLLTGNCRSNAYSKLKAVSLDHYFNFGSFGCDFADRNLLPKVAIKRANEKYLDIQFNNRNTIILGDSPKDIECARNNNIPVISTATGNFSIDQLNSFQPNYTFNNFSDYKKVVSTIINHF